MLLIFTQISMLTVFVMNHIYVRQKVGMGRVTVVDTEYPLYALWCTCSLFDFLSFLLCVPDERYSRHISCALDLISTFLSLWMDNSLLLKGNVEKTERVGIFFTCRWQLS